MLETFRNAWKIDDLRKKIIYTLMIVLVFRLGNVIPVPFIHPDVIKYTLSQSDQMGAILGTMNVMSGGALDSATLFALGISPYITSSIVIQLLAVAIPYLENLSKEGPEGRKKLNTITRYTTLALAVLQATAYYVLNRNLSLPDGTRGVQYLEGFAGVFAAVVIVASFTAGAMLVVWLGEQIDQKGIGNGISILLFVGIVARAPQVIELFIQMFQMGGKYLALLPVVIVIFLFLIFAIVIMTSAERRIPIQYAKRVVGRKMYGGQASYIPIKVTMSGVMPVIFAGAILSLPSMINLVVRGEGAFGKFLNLFNNTSPLYVVLYVILIIAFNYFYVAIQYDPMEMANDIRKQSGTIPGIRPGTPTADFIQRVISRITLVGAVFIAAVAVLPIIMQVATGLQIGLGGTSVIILVNVALEIGKSLESMMMMRHYKGFLG